MPETIKQISFAKLDQGMDMPHLLDIQTRAFEALLQLDAAQHDREDIGLERDFTYSAPLKATLQLVINEVVNEQKRPRNIIEKEVYLGELPLLTPLGT